MLTSRYSLVLFGLALILITACSLQVSDSPGASPLPATSPPDTQVPPTQEPTQTPTLEPTEQALPETPVIGIVGAEPDSTYKVDSQSFEPLEFEEAELPVPPGSVEAHWYRAEGRYVVAYVGLNLSEVGPLCPGNSILTEQGFQYVSNAPTSEGACEGFQTLTSDPDVGPLECHGTVVYLTAIPSDLEGTLYGTLERLNDNGEAIVGLTSAVPSSPDIPVIDLGQHCQ